MSEVFGMRSACHKGDPLINNVLSLKTRRIEHSTSSQRTLPRLLLLLAKLQAL
jgi:hypothetical protein